MFNRRTDEYSSFLENRYSLLFEIADGIRQHARKQSQIGLRLSMERDSQSLGELRALAAELMHRQIFDYLDLAPWAIE